MDWIFEHLNIVIIIGVVIASIFKTQFEAKKKEAEEREVESEERPRTPLDQDKSYRKTPPSAPSVPPPLTRTNIPASGSTPPPRARSAPTTIAWPARRGRDSQPGFEY
mgnify:CR=1 FL=1